MRAQAQRARTQLLQEVVGLMQAAGIDAFIGNTSEELAMANLASLPTVVSCCMHPIGCSPCVSRSHAAVSDGVHARCWRAS